MVNSQTKDTIGIFRAIDLRFIHAEFANSFRKFNSCLVANMSQDIKEYLVSQHRSFTDSKLVPRWFYDPISPILRKKDFTPWLQFNQDEIEKNMDGIKAFEIYEPYFFYSSQIANLANKKDIPLITEIWTSFPNHPARFVPPYSFNTANVIKKTDLFILRSKKALSYLEPYKIPDRKKEVIYHGVNLKRFYPVKKLNKKTTILFVGALHYHKGLDDLLSVFSELVQKYPNKLDLIICGEGPMKDQIMQKAISLPIDFRGKVTNLELADIYRQADIYCQPSKAYFFLGVKSWEEFAGYTIMEALASGLPIVTTNCGGIPEIVGEDNCLVDQGNKKQLIQSLALYINNPQLRKEIGIKNRMRAEVFFDLSKQVDKLESIILKKLL